MNVLCQHYAITNTFVALKYGHIVAAVLLRAQLWSYRGTGPVPVLVLVWLPLSPAHPEEDVNHGNPAALKLIHLLARHPTAFHLKNLVLDQLGVKDQELEPLLQHHIKRSQIYLTFK